MRFLTTYTIDSLFVKRFVGIIKKNTNDINSIWNYILYFLHQVARAVTAKSCGADLLVNKTQKSLEKQKTINRVHIQLAHCERYVFIYKFTYLYHYVRCAQVCNK